MKLKINEDELIYLEKKYGRLIYTICKNISGDPAVLSSHEDNYQELLIKCVESVNSYSKKISQEDVTKFIKTKDFDKYIKTCLWNLKNNKGCKIQKKHSKKKYALDVKEDGSIKNIEAVDCSYSRDIKLPAPYSKGQTEILNSMVNNPNSIMEFNIEKVSERFRGIMCL
jgi:hypothetical protein